MDQIYASDPWIITMGLSREADPWIRFMDQVHGSELYHGSDPWICDPWIGSMDLINRSDPWISSMDQIHPEAVPRGPKAASLEQLWGPRDPNGPGGLKQAPKGPTRPQRILQQK